MKLVPLVPIIKTLLVSTLFINKLVFSFICSIQTSAIPLTSLTSPSPMVEVVAPSTVHTTRHNAKWDQVLPSHVGKPDKGKHKWSQLGAQPRKVRLYYRQLKGDMKVLKEAEEAGRESIEDEDERGEKTKKKRCKKCHCIQLSASTAARFTLAANFLLLFIKLGASIQSGSLSVISSLIDSALDLFSGAVIAITSYLMRHYNPFHYPIGRTRLEPVTIIIIAAVMGTASLQIVTTAIEDMISGSIDLNINGFSGTIMALTIIIKTILFFLCFQVDNASVQALATDHRNDIASNLAALIFGLLGTYVWKYLDPIGAIFLVLYIVINWISVGYEQLKNLVGYRADRRFISKIIYIAKEHSNEILKVDTVRAYTFGINYLVEVHIVLTPNMPLEQAHDIGESLQLKIEALKEVERVFVHLDFEIDHCPLKEHLLPSPN